MSVLETTHRSSHLPVRAGRSPLMLITSFLGMLLVACAGAKQAPDRAERTSAEGAATPETAGGEDVEEPRIELAALSIAHGFRLTETGELSVNGVWVGRMDPQGRFYAPLQNITFHWDPESGEINSESYEFNQRLTPEGVMVEDDGRELHLESDGRVVRDGEELGHVEGFRPGLERTAFLAMIYSALGNAMFATAGNNPEHLRTFVAATLGGAIHDCGSLHSGCVNLPFVHPKSVQRVLTAGAQMQREDSELLYDERAARTFLVEDDDDRAWAESLPVDPDSCYQFKWGNYAAIACASTAFLGIIDLTYTP